MSVADMVAKLVVKVDSAKAQEDLKKFAATAKGSFGDLEARLRVGQATQDQFNQKWGATMQLSRQVGQGMTVAGGAIVGSLGAAAKAASDFNKGMAEVSTLVDTTKVNMASLKDGVNSLAMETGQSANQLTGALYQAISAGVDAGESIKFLGVASKAAVAGVTDTETAVNGITNIINAYGLETKDAAHISDAMFTAVKQGKTTFGELSDSMFQVAPAAAAAGVSMEETLAAISSLTASGVPTAVATTQIRAAMVGLTRPSEDVSKIFKKVGFASAEAAIKQRGLKFALDTVMAASGGSTSKMQQLLGSVEAVNAANILAGQGAKKFAADIDAQANSAGAAAEAFDKMSKDSANAFARLKETGGVLARTIGDAVLPILADAADALQPVVKAFAAFVKTPIGKFGVIAAGAIGGIMLALGPLLMVLPGILSTIQLISGAGGLGALVGSIGGVVSSIGAAVPAISGIGTTLAGLAAAGGPILLVVAALAIMVLSLKRTYDAFKSASAAAQEAKKSWQETAAIEQQVANQRGAGDIAAKQAEERAKAKVTWSDRWWGMVTGGGVTSKDIAQQRTAAGQASPLYEDMKRKGLVRAGGGPVRIGSSYIVGERGPELFVPKQSGSVISNSLVEQAMGVLSQLTNEQLIYTGTVGNKFVKQIAGSVGGKTFDKLLDREFERRFGKGSATANAQGGWAYSDKLQQGAWALQGGGGSSIPPMSSGGGMGNSYTFNFNGPIYGEEGLKRRIQTLVIDALRSAKYATA